MDIDVNKKAFVSGRLNGTRTFKSDLESIREPDEIEQFFISFVNLKLDFNTDNEIKLINDDQSFLECLSIIESSKYISIHETPSFSKLYITTDIKKTYILRLNQINESLIASFIAKEHPIKFALNSFSFIKWCSSKQIDIRNIYDIPTCIKILTNNVDPFKSIESYIEDYSNLKLNDNEDEINAIIISNFIYEFGKFLNSYIEKFNLGMVCKLINENSYFEGETFDNVRKLCN